MPPKGLLPFLLVFLLGAFPSQALAQPLPFRTDTFLYGASVYPELQTWEESLKMLDEFQKAHFTVLRLGESAWGNLEPAPGQYDFGWLKRFLDEMHRRNLKAVLGTNSYIAPQWLFARHPDLNLQLTPGLPVNPLVRKAASIHHPAYRKAVRDFLGAFAVAFKDHPAVIGWQLDNEVDALFNKVDYSRAGQEAFTAWLRKNYGSPQELNRRWGLQAWGLQVTQLEEVKVPSPGVEGDAPVLAFAYQRFVRDAIADFLAEMAGIIQGSGAKQWLTSNFMAFPFIGYDAQFDRSFAVNGLNVYAASNTEAGGWSSLAQHFDLSRSARNVRQFLITECRFGVMGDAKIWDPVASPEQFKMMNLLPAAYGAVGSIYWTGNRYASGHWPHWGGLLDWSGRPEADFSLAVEIGDFYRKWGGKLLRNGVSAKAAILTDYDQVMAHRSYPHTPKNAGEYTTTDFFEAFHRLGIGVDGLTIQQAGQAEKVAAYEVIVLSAASVLNDEKAVLNLRQFVEAGGTLIVTPLVGYQTADGIFHQNGFAANLQSLTGCLVRTVRLIKPKGDAGNTPQRVTLGQTSFAIGAEGFCELLESAPAATAAGKFTVQDPYLNGRPALVGHKIGKGKVFKLAFWPEGRQLPHLISTLCAVRNPFFNQVLPPALHAVPRTDGSIFLANTSGKSVTLKLIKAGVDRLTGKRLTNALTLAPYQLVWLE
jgi:beta-galactosidase